MTMFVLLVPAGGASGRPETCVALQVRLADAGETAAQTTFAAFVPPSPQRGALMRAFLTGFDRRGFGVALVGSASQAVVTAFAGADPTRFTTAVDRAASAAFTASFDVADRARLDAAVRAVLGDASDEDAVAAADAAAAHVFGAGFDGAARETLDAAALKAAEAGLTVAPDLRALRALNATAAAAARAELTARFDRNARAILDASVNNTDIAAAVNAAVARSILGSFDKADAAALAAAVDRAAGRELARALRAAGWTALEGSVDEALGPGVEALQTPGTRARLYASVESAILSALTTAC
jgi:hypothetical protein